MSLDKILSSKSKREKREELVRYLVQKALEQKDNCVCIGDSFNLPDLKLNVFERKVRDHIDELIAQDKLNKLQLLVIVPDNKNTKERQRNYNFQRQYGDYYNCLKLIGKELGSYPEVSRIKPGTPIVYGVDKNLDTPTTPNSKGVWAKFVKESVKTKDSIKASSLTIYLY